MPTTVRISWILVVLYWVWAWLTWTNAPDQVPLHFGFSGEPTRWGARSVVSWFGPPALATLLAAGFGFLGRWAAERPERLNLPGRERLAGIPVQHQGPVREAVKAILGWVTLETVILMGLVQWATVRGAAGHDTQAVIGLLFAAAIVGSPVLVTLVVTRSQRAFDEAARRAVTG